MSFVKRAATTTRPEIPEGGARKEAEIIFHIIKNIDQTPLKFAPASSQTMATKNSKHVHETGFSYKQAITGTFGILLSNRFLPMQLIYGGKTTQS